MKPIRCIELCISGECRPTGPSRAVGASVRVLEKSHPSLTSSAYCRYLGQRKYSELLELLYNGSMLLLQHEQVMSVARRECRRIFTFPLK